MTATAPTEEEIRAAIAREWTDRPPTGPTIEVDFSDAFTRCTGLLDGLYDLDDLRDSELGRLLVLTSQAIDPIREEARRQINSALGYVALTFAAEYPDAPRARRLVSVAGGQHD
jgi:hypothetical protein